MDASKMAVSAATATWLIASLAGCVTPGAGDSPVDRRVATLHPKVPFRNSTFDFITPQFGGENHVITKDDFNKLSKDMNCKDVEAMLGRKPDFIECPGGGLGRQDCYWYEENATIIVVFAFRGKMTSKSFTPTTQSERPDWLKKSNEPPKNASNDAPSDGPPVKKSADAANDPMLAYATILHEFEKIGSGLFGSANLGMSGRKSRHITEDDLKLISKGMSREAVCAILGREPDWVLRTGGSLGGQECGWVEEYAVIHVGFDFAGNVDATSFSLRSDMKLR